jgi:hypothetical protein
MANLLDGPRDPAKLLVVGDTGTAKTGCKASLICMGYKIRSINTDKGHNIMRTLLTSDRWPYAKWIKDHNIDIREAYLHKPIDTPMEFRTITKKQGNKEIRETLLAPKTSAAWGEIMDHLSNWKEEGKSYGNITDWGSDVIADFDTLSTIATQALYFTQAFNGRLGAMESGNDWQRDVGGAQTQLRRMFEMFANYGVHCNVIANTHITAIEISDGVNRSPEQVLREANASGVSSIDPRGFPMLVGRALSRVMGKFWNDAVITRQTGSGLSTRYEIATVPSSVDGVLIGAKSSGNLKPVYDVSTGMAEIFSELTGTPLPDGFLETLGKKPQGNQGTTSLDTRAPRNTAVNTAELLGA